MLTNLIKFAGGRFERDCHRLLERAVNAVEEFSGDVTEIRVARFPLESVSQFHLKDNETDGWVLQSSVDYLVRRACVISLGGALGNQAQQAKVTYTGGYVLPGSTPGSGQTALPDELEGSTLHLLRTENLVAMHVLENLGKIIATHVIARPSDAVLSLLPKV